VLQAPGFALGHWNLAIALLAAGIFEGGWSEYEWRWQWDGFPGTRRRLTAVAWSGEPLAGKRIVVWAEQGYGDVIQFAPLVSRLAEAGAEVVFEVPPPLLRLLQHNLAGVTVTRLPDSPFDSIPHFAPEFILPHMSLPHRLALVIDDLPLSTKPLRPIPADEPAWAQRIPAGPRRKVGLVWAGRPAHADDARRSMPFRALRPLFRQRAVDWYSLQVGPRAADSRMAPIGRLTDLSPMLTDFAETAAAIARLDLVITVDTAVAHLAAAMGRPTWLLLSKVADWRWAKDAVADRWYPSVRIFRQRHAGDWPGVVKAVSEALGAPARAALDH
jgi:hypothetical protein